jgi:hypothetical protein
VAKIEGDPTLSAIGKAQASCRESAKEIENMLLPNLRQKLAKAPNAAEAAKLLAPGKPGSLGGHPADVQTHRDEGN